MTDERLLRVHLSVFGIGNDVIDIDRVRNFPFVDDFTVLEIHAKD
jgi:hypothetical protein